MRKSPEKTETSNVIGHHLFSKPKECPKCGGKTDEVGESNFNWFDICKKCGSVFYYRTR